MHRRGARARFFWREFNEWPTLWWKNGKVSVRAFFLHVSHEKKTMVSVAGEFELPSVGDTSSGGSDSVSSMSDGSMVFSESFGKEMEKAVALCTMKGLVGKCVYLD